MVKFVWFESTTNPGEVICAPEDDIISVEDLDEVTKMELRAELIEITLTKDNEEVLRELLPVPCGIGRPTNYEEFQKGVEHAYYVYCYLHSLFIDQKMVDWFASSLGCLTEYEKGVSYHDKFLERLISLSEQEPTKEAPDGPVAAYDLLIQYSEDLIRDGKRLPEILASFSADVLADARRDKAEKKRPRPKCQKEKPGYKRAHFIRNKALDIAILALVREGWTEVGDESIIKTDKKGREWANSAVFAVGRSTNNEFWTVKKATTKYRRQREHKLN